MRKALGYAGLAVLISASGVLADDGQNLREMLWEIARGYSIRPVAALEVLARVESKMNPLAIHLSARKDIIGPKLRRDGIPHSGPVRRRGRHHYSVYPRTRKQAEGLLRWAVKARVSYDVGLLQIWRGNVEKYGLDPVILLDPEANAVMGGYIFRQCLARYGGDFWRSVECYHHGRFRGRPTYYSDSVYSAIRRIIKEWESRNRS